jgi:putative membrane protein
VRPSLGLTGVQWSWLGSLAVALTLAQIDQPYPDVAWLQHTPTLLVLLSAPFLLRRWPLSDVALGHVVVFLLLHTLGGRYTYSSVPYDEWAKAITGHTLSATFGWSRNHYDRLVHLSFGLLMIRPVLEVCQLKGMVRRAGLWVALAFVLSISCLYEILEWALAVIVAGPLADRYNGQQGDMFDSQKDMAMAMLGALIACGWLALLGRRDLKKG